MPGLPPFQGGAAGLFSYELGRSLERLPAAALDTLAFPDLSLGLYDVVVALDLIERRGFILSTGLPETDGRLRERARGRPRALVRGASPAPSCRAPRRDDFACRLDQQFQPGELRADGPRGHRTDSRRRYFSSQCGAAVRSAGAAMISIISASTAACAYSIPRLFRPISRIKISSSPRPRPNDF